MRSRRVRAATLARLALPGVLAACGASQVTPDASDAPRATETSLDANATDVVADTPSPTDVVGVTDATDAGLAPIDRALRLCAMLDGCGLGSSTVGLGVCAYGQVLIDEGYESSVDPTARMDAMYWDCVEAAADCAAAFRCAAGGHDATYCAMRPGYSCDGDVRVYCDPSGRVVALDCGLASMHCAATGDGGAECTDGVTCAAADASSGSTTTARCDGTRAINCGPNAFFQGAFDCATTSPPSTCTGGTGSAAAVCGPYLACAPTDPPYRCDGDVLRICNGEYGVTIDCARSERHCGPAGDGGTVACLPVGHDCSDSSTPDTCAGASIRTCVSGSFRTFDCTSIGLTRCTPSPQPHCT